MFNKQIAKKRIGISLFGGLFFLVIFVTWLIAGPVVIRDNRIRDLGVTPVLGRGYSLSTNTFQSTCLTNIVLTEPSYDMIYSFSRMDSTRDVAGETANINSALYTKAFKGFLEKEDMKKASEKDSAGQSAIVGSKFKGNEKKTRIMVTIDLHSYYASVDESKSQMSETAKRLLEKKDYPGFFHSCGSYYIRSIGRNAKFISMFKFESVSTEEDISFIYQLETEIKSFRKKLIASADSTTPVTASASGETGPTETFNEKATRMNLTITSAAFGLGKNEKASLISYDIGSFKAAIKDAFISMQNPRTGKVTSMEVIPWVENTQFQDVVKLEESDPIYEEYTDENGKTQKRKKTVLLYEKKHILNLNAEFLAEIERADRNKLNIFYKSKLCKSQIQTNYKRGSGGARIFKVYQGKSYGDRWVRNNRGGIATVTLKELDAVLKPSRIEALYRDREKFMHTARACMNIMINKIFSLSYRDIKECTSLQKVMGQMEDEIIDDQCMPSLHGWEYDPQKARSKKK